MNLKQLRVLSPRFEIISASEEAVYYCNMGRSNTGRSPWKFASLVIRQRGLSLLFKE